jgi:hypothetical protein
VVLAVATGATVVAIAAGLLAPVAGRVARFALAGAATAPIPQGWQSVSYQGVHLAVPGSWPVVNLRANPRVCPRLDVHAVYLGKPGPQPRCPASGLGAKTEAVQILPARPGSPQVVGATEQTTVGGVQALTSPATGSSAVSHTITEVFPAAKALIELTYGTDEALIRQVQGTIRVTAGRPAQGRRLELMPAAALPLGQAQGLVKGYGFDTCSAPSAGVMRAWLSSPYRSVGVYIGGADEACSQPYLTASWISTVERNGWHVFPLYPGPQAPCVDAPGNLTFSPSQAASAGTAAAADAANQAHNLGLPGRTPLIYDMEAYSGCGRAVTTFLNAWDRELHAKGYGAAVYESTSNIGDLVSARGWMTEPDDIFYANWDGQATTLSSYMPSNMWANHQRIHQYSGNVYQTFGGITLGIDQDRLNINMGGLSAAGRPQAAAVDYRGTVRVYDRGSRAGPLWEDHLTLGTGSAWSWFNMSGTWPSTPTALAGTDGSVRVFAVGTTGSLYEKGLPKGGSWSGWTDLGGKWQWGAAAVAQPSGTARVYAVGSTGALYQAHLRSNGSWSSWADLGGSKLTGIPAATVDNGGVVRVFARSGSGSLWEASLSPGRNWAWTNLGGDWAYDPAVVTLPDGSSRVFEVSGWGRLWQRHVRANGTISGWIYIGFSRLMGTPAAVVDRTGVVRLFTRVTPGNLKEEYLPPGGKWITDNLGGAWPEDASAVVDNNGIIRVYAVGNTGQLYEDHRRLPNNWSGWFGLGGP